jgi:hypothetical protein
MLQVPAGRVRLILCPACYLFFMSVHPVAAKCMIDAAAFHRSPHLSTEEKGIEESTPRTMKAPNLHVKYWM